MDILKKDPESGSDKDKAARMAVLQHIHKMATDAMGSDYMGKDSPDGSMAKATVEASDPAGLKEGLDKAADLVSKAGEPLDSDAMDDSDDDSSDEDDVSSDQHPGQPPASDLLKGQIDHESSEGDLSDDEIESLIADLQAKRQGK